MTDDIKKTPNNSPQPGESTKPQAPAQPQPPAEPVNQTVADENPPTEPEQHSAHKPKKDNNTLIAVVLAILVAVVIIGLGYAALNSSISEIEETPTETETSQTEESQEPAVEPVNEETFDQELNQLEQDAESLGDESAFSEEDLSDENLELQ